MRLLERWFMAYGRYLSRNPKPYIIVPVIITIVSMYGLQFFYMNDDIWDAYAPSNGRSRVEEKELERFEFASGAHHYRMQVLATLKDDGDMLQMSVLDELSAAHQAVKENITARATVNGTEHISLPYAAICGVYCKKSNEVLISFLQTYVDARGDPAIEMTYPNAEILDEKVYLGYSVAAITLDNASPQHVLEARMIILHYMIDETLPGGTALAKDFETKLRDHFAALTNSSSTLRYQLMSKEREIEEQRIITLIMFPYFGATVVVLSLFMLFTLVDFPLYKSQHIESFFGVLSPHMALATAVGFLWWAGYEFSNILAIVPFLTVTIGIDDAFLILSGWRHSTPGASLEQRMGESVAASGASVTVTAVTDVLCFGIGLFSNMPVVRLFCIYTSVALFILFFYQMTFFCGIVCVLGERQIKIEKKRGINTTGPTELSLKSGKAEQGSDANSPDKPAGKDRSRYLEMFVEWIHSKFARFFVILLFLVHIAVGSYFATKINTQFDMENLYLTESPLTEISKRMQDHWLREAFVVNFGVYPMPDFSNSTIRDRFEKMLHSLERIPKYTMLGTPEESTNVWTRDLAKIVGGETSSWKSENLLQVYRDNDLEEECITMGKDAIGNDVITGFSFTITYKNFSSCLDVEEMMEQRRSILAEYAPEITVFSYNSFEKIPTESAAAAPSNFLQTAVSAIVLMSVLVLLFVMDLEAIVSVVLSITSICLGTVSYLHVWGVHLDAVSLIDILMSIGFSVDYSAHICYHYFAHAAEEVDNHEEQTERFTGTPRVRRSKLRLFYTIQGVGYPVVQAGLSTIIGMIPLIFIKAYVVAVFWKTVIIVGVLGIIHALLLLPVIFILTDDVKALYQRKPTVAPSTSITPLKELSIGPQDASPGPWVYKHRYLCNGTDSTPGILSN